jgi:hypothetical protein
MSSIGGTGGVSFWQQDQNYWNQVQQGDAKQSESSAVISNLFGASTTLSNGLSSIANQKALTRTNNALTAAVQSALQQEQGTSSSTGSTASSSSGSGTSSVTTPPAVTPPGPASGTGTATLTGGTPLYGLDYTISGTFTVSDNNNTTTYKVTQGSTVGDLINAVNSNAAGNASAFAYLNTSGNLVVTGTDTTQTISVGGNYAAALGFGGSNTTFAPTAGTTGAISMPGASNSSSPSSSSAPSSSSSGSSATGSSSTGTVSKPSGIPLNSAHALQTGGTAEILLAGNGLAGSILDMLA